MLAAGSGEFCVACGFLGEFGIERDRFPCVASREIEISRRGDVFDEPRKIINGLNCAKLKDFVNFYENVVIHMVVGVAGEEAARFVEVGAWIDFELGQKPDELCRKILKGEGLFPMLGFVKDGVP